jgi:tetratricopeptide (TPR) repeat protein
MLTYGGRSVAVFGLWATYAAEPVHGVNVSDRLFTFLYSENKRPARTVWPATRDPWAAGAVSDANARVDLNEMHRYLPPMTEAELAAAAASTNPYANPPAALRRILIETSIYRRLSMDVLRARMPDLTIVYFQGTDSIGHVFAPFAPPKQPSVSQEDYDRYHAVPEQYFRDIDALLGDYMAVAQSAHATLMIASDHGFHWVEGRPTQISSTNAATAAKWHRNEGIYLLWGDGIAAQPNHPLRGGVRQVCATLLALTGMPAPATGLAPLPGAAAPQPPIDYARFFQRAPPPPAPSSSQGTTEEIAKLKALGYIGSEEPTRSAAGGSDTRTAGAYNNMGLLLRNDKKTDDAVRAFRQALAIDPNYSSAMWNLSETLFDAQRDLDTADSLLVSALKNGLADGTKFTVARALEYRRTGRDARAVALLNAAIAVQPGDPELRLFRGGFEMSGHDCAAALADFEAAARTQPSANAFASAGMAQMCLGDAGSARENFRRSLALDPNQPQLRQLVGQ